MFVWRRGSGCKKSASLFQRMLCDKCHSRIKNLGIISLYQMNRNSNITKGIMSGLVYLGITFLFAFLIYNFKK